MKRNRFILWVGISFLLIGLLSIQTFGTKSYAQGKPIVIGAPLATAFLYGWDAARAITLATEEINAQGGIPILLTSGINRIEHPNPQGQLLHRLV